MDPIWLTDYLNMDPQYGTLLSLCTQTTNVNAHLQEFTLKKGYLVIYYTTHRITFEYAFFNGLLFRLALIDTRINLSKYEKLFFYDGYFLLTTSTNS